MMSERGAPDASRAPGEALASSAAASSRIREKCPRSSSRRGSWSEGAVDGNRAPQPDVADRFARWRAATPREAAIAGLERNVRDLIYLDGPGGARWGSCQRRGTSGRRDPTRTPSGSPRPDADHTRRPPHARKGARHTAARSRHAPASIGIGHRFKAPRRVHEPSCGGVGMMARDSVTRPRITQAPCERGRTRVR